MKIVYPRLVSEIAMRGIKKKAIAAELNISEKSLYNKMTGAVSFTWEETCAIRSRFFPDITDKDILFEKNNALDSA